MVTTRVFKNETAFTNWLCGQLERAGCVIWTLVGGSRQRSGLPDRFIHMPRPHPAVAAEFKRKQNPPKAHQRRVLDELVRTSTVPLVIRDAHPLVTIEKADGTVLKATPSAELQMMKPKALLDWLVSALPTPTPPPPSRCS